MSKPHYGDSIFLTESCFMGTIHVNALHVCTKVTIVAALIGAVAGCGQNAPQADSETSLATKPNVVLIVMDTLRADRVHATRDGQPVMPFLSRMAESGTAYTRAISPCSWTKPAMASIFTGLHPQRHGVIYSARMEDPEHPTSDRLSKSYTTLAESLQSAGYATWAFQTNANLTAALGFAQGYPPEDYHFSNGATAPQVTATALKRLSALAEPFFIYTHYMEPHAPYRPAPRYADALGPLPALPDYDQTLLGNDGRFMAYYLDQVKTALGLQGEATIPDLSTAGKAAVEHRYDLECFAMDQSIERLVTEIQERHPNTLFVFLSDHGEEFWERGGMGHGTTLHQEQVHVPFILVGPDIPSATVGDTVSTLDLFPTLMTLLDLPPVDSDGVPLAVSSASRPVYAFSRGPWPALGVDTVAVFQDGYSFLRDQRRNEASLFYVEDDASEKRNLYEKEPTIAARLAAQLSEHLRKVGNAEGNNTLPLDDAARGALEALGYVDTL